MCQSRENNLEDNYSDVPDKFDCSYLEETNESDAKSIDSDITAVRGRQRIMPLF